MLNLGITSFFGAKQVLCQAGSTAYIARLPASKIAIIATDRSVENYPIINKTVENKKRFDAKIFIPKWKGEPKLSEIKQSVSEILDFKPDWIVAIGGGSVLDGAKLVWALYENPSFDLERLSIPFALPQLRKKAKLVAVPTTAGTGSEASSAAVVTSEDGKSKIPVVTHEFLPDVAILDSNLLKDIPINVLVPSMLDALSHALEGFASKMQNRMATNLVEFAASNLLESFRLLKQDKNNQGALEMALIGAYYAGIIQNLNVVGPAHALAHNMPFVPHGVATGLLLPSVVKFQASKNEDLNKKYNRLGEKLGFKDINGFFDELYKDILPSLGITPKISSFVNYDDSNFDEYAELAINDNLSRFFPVEVEKQDLINILKESF